MLDSESWTQGCGSGILGPKSRILNPGLQDAGSGALDPGLWIRDPGSRILHAGSRILDQDPGAGTLDAGSEIHDLPESWMLEFQQTSWFRVLVITIHIYIYIYIYISRELCSAAALTVVVDSGRHAEAVPRYQRNSTDISQMVL